MSYCVSAPLKTLSILKSVPFVRSIRSLTLAVALKTGVVDLGTGSLCPRGDGLR